MEEESRKEIETNEKVVEDLTKDLESQFTISSDIKSSHQLQNNSAAEIGHNEQNSGVPGDFEQSDEELTNKVLEDDYVDEEHLKDLELTLTEEDSNTRHKEALKLKAIGNEEFKMEKFLDSVNTYTKALRLCPLKYSGDRSIFYANRAASKAKLERKESAIEDCSKAIELNEKYVRAYLRRARLYEETDKLDECLADYNKLLEFDPGNKDALEAQYRLPPLIAERNEKLKTEMLGKLKDLGNMILRPFGLSTDNFQLNQDPNSGGYSVNFSQNTK